MVIRETAQRLVAERKVREARFAEESRQRLEESKHKRLPIRAESRGRPAMSAPTRTTA
jgi:hypothetical protein